MWVPRTKPGSSTRTTGALNHWAICPVPAFIFKTNKISIIHCTRTTGQAGLTFSVHFFPFLLLCHFFSTELKSYYKCIFFLSPHLIGTVEITKLRSAKHFLSICHLEALRSVVLCEEMEAGFPGGRWCVRNTFLLGSLGKYKPRQ